MTASATAEREIKAVLEGVFDAVRRKDAKTIANFYTADARFMLPNTPIAQGHTAIEATWAGMLATPGFAFEFGPTYVEAAAGGDLAYEVGAYRMSFDGPKGRIDDRGKYIVVWRKVGGTWKLAADIGNSDLPVPES